MALVSTYAVLAAGHIRLVAVKECKRSNTVSESLIQEVADMEGPPMVARR